jgi:hypothetical protein
LLEETAAIDERTVGIRTIIVFSEEFAEAADIASLHRIYIIPIEGLQHLKIGGGLSRHKGSSR